MQYFLDRKLAVASLVSAIVALVLYGRVAGFSFNGLLGGALAILLCSGFIFAITTVFKKCRNKDTFYKTVIIISIGMIVGTLQ